MLLTDSRNAQVVARLQGGVLAGELATRAAASSWKSGDYGDDRDCKGLPRSGVGMFSGICCHAISGYKAHRTTVSIAMWLQLEADSDTGATSLLAVRPQSHSNQ